MRLVRAAASSLPGTIAAVAALAASAVALAAALFGTSIGGGAALYFVVWWTVLFAVLPFGARHREDDGDRVPGNEPGAPASPLLREKAIWTTLAADVVLIAAMALLPLTGL